MQRKPMTAVLVAHPDLPVLLVGLAGLGVALGMSLAPLL
jgi:hypothetical protein